MAARVEREKQNAINVKLQAELQAKKDAEAKAINDRLAAERAALVAPDKEKIRALYDYIKNISIPVLNSNPGKIIANLTAIRIKDLLAEIATESKKLL